MSATMAPPRAFEIRGREWIIRPWETTLQLPELDEDAGVIGLRVPQEIMGIPCAIGWLVGAWTGELRGIGIGFPNTWVIAVRLLPGDPLNRVEAGAYPSFPLMGDALARRELFAPDIDPDYDAMELLALIREVAGREHEAQVFAGASRRALSLAVVELGVLLAWWIALLSARWGMGRLCVAVWCALIGETEDAAIALWQFDGALTASGMMVVCGFSHLWFLIRRGIRRG